MSRSAARVAIVLALIGCTPYDATDRALWIKSRAAAGTITIE